MHWLEWAADGPTLDVTDHRRMPDAPAVNAVGIAIADLVAVRPEGYTAEELAFLRDHPGAVWSLCGRPGEMDRAARSFARSKWCYQRVKAARRGWWAHTTGG
jgi:hypothetical protein